MPIKVAVVGNCQARPVADLVARLAPSVTVSTVAVVHLLNDHDEAQYAQHFAAADVIFAQRVVDTYPCTFVRTGALRDQYSAKVVTWPNLYFSGYNPELFYLKTPKKRNALGPLGEYHIREIHAAWTDGTSVDAAVSRVLSVDHNEQQYGRAPERSLAELAEREKDTNVQISSWLAERRWQQRLFFTFNHPSQALLVKTARLLLRVADISFAEVAKPVSEREPLGKIRCPVNPYIRTKHTLPFGDEAHYHGQHVNGLESGPLVLGDKRQYTLRELAESFYKTYDSFARTARDEV